MGGVATIPPVIAPTGSAQYFEVMTRAVFQSGVSWKQIAAHWDAYAAAFADFDVAAVAAFGALAVERALAVPGILRSPRKVRATIENARGLIEAERAFGDFPAYLHAFDGYPALAKDFTSRFAFMGPMNVWYFLFRTGEPVPRFEAWVATIPGEHPRMREMVDLARAAGLSHEYGT